MVGFDPGLCVGFENNALWNLKQFISIVYLKSIRVSIFKNLLNMFSYTNCSSLWGDK